MFISLKLSGTPGCGKTLLLKSLAANGTPGSIKKHSASVPTTGQSPVTATSQETVFSLTGANIVNVQKAKGTDQPPDVVSIREIGGEVDTDLPE